MSSPSALASRLSRALTTPTGGVLGLVDELLAASRGQAIRLGWQGGVCHVSIQGAVPPEQIAVPVPKAVVRAALARVAALCNERVPGSVSPYRGSGEVVVDSATVLRVWFVNTADEQSLELAPARPDGAAEPLTPAEVDCAAAI